MGKHICQGQVFHNKTFVSAEFLGSQTHSYIYKHLRTQHQLSVLKRTLMDSCFSPTLDSL